jgi:hypothetical protein
VGVVPTTRAFGRIRTLAFDPESRSDRLVADWVPLAEGGIPCILVASPASPSLRLVQATRDGSLRVHSVPSVTGVTQILIAPPAKKRDAWHIGLVSRTEKSIAFGQLNPEGDTLTFPQPIQVGGAPLTAALAPLGRGKALDLAVCRNDGRGGLILDVHYDLNPATGEEAGLTSFTLRGTEGDRPSGLLAVDLNRDGRTDLLALFDYADPVLLLQTQNDHWEALNTGEGMLQGLLTGARAGNVLTAPLGPDGSTDLLVTKENYARAVHLDADNRLVIDHQFNARNQRSRLRAAMVAYVSGPEIPHVVLLDVGNQCLTLYKQTGDRNGFELDRHVDLDEADYQTLLAADINEDRNEDILLLAPDRMTVVYSGMSEGHLETVAKAKTEVEDGGYGLVKAATVLKGDRQQILVVEKVENVLEFFLNEAEEGQLRQFYRFKVFQGDMVRQRREAAFLGQTEPRELAAGDLDGDAKPDLVLLMHDVLGVYYQE